MATVTYINNNYQTLATAMQDLVTKGYFDSVEYDSTNSAVVCYDADENEVLTLTYGASAVSITFRFDDGTTKTITQNNATIAYAYNCSGGMYLHFTGGSNSAGLYGGMMISKTNNDSVGIVWLGIGSPAASQRLANVRSWATDDDTTQVETLFTFATPTLRNQTQLNEIPTCNAIGTPSVFSDVRSTFTSQIPYTSNTATPPINFYQDNKRYLWVGYFAIRDEEETS